MNWWTETGYSHCELPLSRMVLTRDLKEAYKSGKFSSSKVKRCGRSEKELDKAARGAATDNGATDTDGGDGADTVQAGTKEYAGRGEGPVCAGYGWESAAAEETPEAAGTGGRGGEREWKEVMGAAGGSPAEAEATGRLNTELGM